MNECGYKHTENTIFKSVHLNTEGFKKFPASKIEFDGRDNDIITANTAWFQLFNISWKFVRSTVNFEVVHGLVGSGSISSL